jgi:hypothetical protein
MRAGNGEGEGGLKRKKAALFGCGLLENLADLTVQRGRRTWRNPSSSQERRRQVARRLVRVNIMGCGHTAEKQALSRSFGRNCFSAHAHFGALNRANHQLDQSAWPHAGEHFPCPYQHMKVNRDG